MDWNKLREDLDLALEKIGKEHNVKMKANTITYGDKTFDFSVQGVILEDGKSVDQIIFEEYCKEYGLTPEDYGRVIFDDEKKYKIVGINYSEKEYPFILKKEDGDIVKATVKFLKKVWCSPSMIYTF